MTQPTLNFAANFAAKGTRDPDRLPYTCRCGARWDGTRTAHCSACHVTFAGVAPFDAHRRSGVCVEPAIAGLSPVQGRAYTAWGYPDTPPTPPDALRAAQAVIAAHQWRRALVVGPPGWA